MILLRGVDFGKPVDARRSAGFCEAEVMPAGDHGVVYQSGRSL
jgi:hypothetical protein